MAYVMQLLAVQPTGVWEKIIMAFENAIGNYAWAIILLTLCIKLILSPLDFFNKKITRKNTEAQAKIKPKLDDLQKQYANDRNMLAQKQNELYKKEGISMGGSCVFMLINLVATMVIFFTLFSGLNQMANYKIISQYEDLRSAYITTTGITVEENSYISTEQVEELDITIITSANEAVVAEYGEVKDSWLWINNVWIADRPDKNSIPSFDEYVSASRLSFKDVEGGLTATEQKELARTEYNIIMSPLRETKGGANGYLIVAALAVLATFLSQFFMQQKMKKKGNNPLDPNVAKPKANIIMMILMPLLIGYFAFSYNAVFGLYMVVGQLFSLAVQPLYDLIIDKWQNRKNRNADGYTAVGRYTRGK